MEKFWFSTGWLYDISVLCPFFKDCRSSFKISISNSKSERWRNFDFPLGDFMIAGSCCCRLLLYSLLYGWKPDTLQCNKYKWITTTNTIEIQIQIHCSYHHCFTAESLIPYNSTNTNTFEIQIQIQMHCGYNHCFTAGSMIPQYAKMQIKHNEKIQRQISWLYD